MTEASNQSSQDHLSEINERVNGSRSAKVYEALRVESFPTNSGRGMIVDAISSTTMSARVTASSIIDF